MMMRRAAVLLAVLCLIPAAALAAEDKKPAAPKDTYVAIDTLTAAVAAMTGRREVLTIQSGIDVPDPALYNLASKDQPRLRDAYVQVMQAYAGTLSPGAPPDADYIVQQLQKATDRVLGKPGARFLIGGVMVN